MRCVCPQRVTFDQVVAIVRSMYAAVWFDITPHTRAAASHRSSPQLSLPDACNCRGRSLGPDVNIKEPAFIAERCRHANLSSAMVQ